MRTIHLAFTCISIVTIVGCGPGSRPTGPDADTQCTGGQRCSGNTLEVCSDGHWVASEECPMACDDMLGCVVCRPGTGTCNGDTATECRPDGSGYHDVFCDPVQGMHCGSAGTCEGACSPLALGETYFGCDYYPTVTGNPVSNAYDFAVVVSNTSATVANVTVEGGLLGNPRTFTVPAGAAVAHRLPWVPELKLCNQPSSFGCTGGGQPTGGRRNGGAYRLRTDVPVTVYQFNPLDYTLPGAPENSYTNDASLLFPVTSWRSDHFVAAWNNTLNLHPSLMTVTASENQTAVTITTKGNTMAVGGAPSFQAGVPQTVMLDRGDALQLGTLDGDMTGSHVVSDKPVQVIGGQYCANVPDNMGYCDHLEELMLSVDALGAEYVVNAPAVVTIPQGKVEMVRIVAVESGTTLEYDPPQPGAPTTIANAGDWVQLTNTAASFQVSSNNKIIVAQFMEGSTVAGGTGDPSMSLAVPTDQFRSEYLFHAPVNYETNYVDITAPMGATIMLDGMPIPALQPIGASGWGLSRVTPLNDGPGADGNHMISGDMGFGISVYGYGMDTSYWYPGGLNLGRIIVE